MDLHYLRYLIGFLLLAVGPAATSPDMLKSVTVVGTAFRTTFASGRVVEGKALEGAVLTLSLPNDAAPQRIRLERIIADPDDPEILLHHIIVLSGPADQVREELCEPDAQGERWAYPLAGRWDNEGRRLGGKGLTLACAAGGALGKCVRWGYKPWGTMPNGDPRAAYHAACVHMVRADYCGGHGTTRDGMTIDYFDGAGLHAPDDRGSDAAGLRFEAAWTPQGALCVAHTRVVEHMTLSRLARSCPRLSQHIGAENCIEGKARKGYYGKALLFNRSR